MAKHTLTDEAILAQIPAARARVGSRAGPTATDVRYDPAAGRVLVDLSNGCQIGFPSEMAQGLRGARPEELAEGAVTLDGAALRWESLDADLLVSGLLEGVFGSEAWTRRMAQEMGRRGGSVRSDAKARAARRNGRKGGRPRKTGSG